MRVIHSRRGFTLLEIILAVFLLVGGIASSTFLFSRGILATTDAEGMEQSTGLAQERAENLRAAAFASIVNEPKAPISGWAGFSRQVDVTQPPGTNSNFKQVVVTVYRDTGNGEISTSLTTYVTHVANN